MTDDAPHAAPAEPTAEYLVYRRGAGRLEPNEVRILVEACRTLLNERERIRVELARIHRAWSDVRYGLNQLDRIAGLDRRRPTVAVSAVRWLPDGRVLGVDDRTELSLLHEFGATGGLLRTWPFPGRSTAGLVMTAWDGAGEPHAPA